MALLEGDYVARLPGSIFKEVTFKTEQATVEKALPQWVAPVNRRWAKLEVTEFHINVGTLAISFEKC